MHTEQDCQIAHATYLYQRPVVVEERLCRLQRARTKGALSLLVLSAYQQICGSIILSLFRLALQ